MPVSPEAITQLVQLIDEYGYQPEAITDLEQVVIDALSQHPKSVHLDMKDSSRRTLVNMFIARYGSDTSEAGIDIKVKKY